MSTGVKTSQQTNKPVKRSRESFERTEPSPQQRRKKPRPNPKKTTPRKKEEHKRRPTTSQKHRFSTFPPHESPDAIVPERVNRHRKPQQNREVRILKKLLRREDMKDAQRERTKRKRPRKRAPAGRPVGRTAGRSFHVQPARRRKFSITQSTQRPRTKGKRSTKFTVHSPPRRAKQRNVVERKSYRPKGRYTLRNKRKATITSKPAVHKRRTKTAAGGTETAAENMEPGASPLPFSPDFDAAAEVNTFQLEDGEILSNTEDEDRSSKSSRSPKRREPVLYKGVMYDVRAATWRGEIECDNQLIIVEGPEQEDVAKATREKAANLLKDGFAVDKDVGKSLEDIGNTSEDAEISVEVSEKTPEETAAPTSDEPPEEAVEKASPVRKSPELAGESPKPAGESPKPAGESPNPADAKPGSVAPAGQLQASPLRGTTIQPTPARQSFEEGDDVLFDGKPAKVSKILYEIVLGAGGARMQVAKELLKPALAKQEEKKARAPRKQTTKKWKGKVRALPRNANNLQKKRKSRRNSDRDRQRDRDYRNNRRGKR